MSFHPIVTENREYQAFVKETDKVLAARAKFFERQVKTEAAYKTRLAEYNADQEACLLRGEAPGYSKPEPPQLEGQASVFQDELMRIENAQRAWLGRRSEDLLDGLLDREAAIRAEALGHFIRLRELVAEANVARETAQTVSGASPGGRAVIGHQVTLDGLEQAARTGSSVIVAPVSMRTGEGGLVSLPMNLDDIEIHSE